MPTPSPDSNIRFSVQTIATLVSLQARPTFRRAVKTLQARFAKVQNACSTHPKIIASISLLQYSFCLPPSYPNPVTVRSSSARLTHLVRQASQNPQRRFMLDPTRNGFVIYARHASSTNRNGYESGCPRRNPSRSGVRVKKQDYRPPRARRGQCPVRQQPSRKSAPPRCAIGNSVVETRSARDDTRMTVIGGHGPSDPI